MLASLILGIVYVADAEGSQPRLRSSEADGWGDGREVVERELLTGVPVGVTVAIAFYPLALGRWGDLEVAISTALALLATCSTATVLGIALP